MLDSINYGHLQHYYDYHKYRGSHSDIKFRYYILKLPRFGHGELFHAFFRLDDKLVVVSQVVLVSDHGPAKRLGKKSQKTRPVGSRERVNVALVDKQPAFKGTLVFSANLGVGFQYVFVSTNEFLHGDTALSFGVGFVLLLTDYRGVNGWFKLQFGGDHVHFLSVGVAALLDQLPHFEALFVSQTSVVLNKPVDRLIDVIVLCLELRLLGRTVLVRLHKKVLETLLVVHTLIGDGVYGVYI